MARAKKKFETYFFKTIEELHAIPLEKVEAFTIDLKLWLQSHRIAELMGKSVLKITTPTDVFGWIDDGRHDVRVHLSASPQAVAAVDLALASSHEPSTRARNSSSDRGHL